MSIGSPNFDEENVCLHCGERHYYHDLFRCFDCRAWLCEPCTRIHFGNQHEPHPMHLRQWEERVAALEAVIAQHDLCHNLHGKVDVEAFAEGCAAEQRKLYGCAPDATDATRYRWILTQAAITDFIFKHLKSRERHVSNAIDEEMKK